MSQGHASSIARAVPHTRKPLSSLSSLGGALGDGAASGVPAPSCSSVRAQLREQRDRGRETEAERQRQRVDACAVETASAGRR